MKTKLTKEEINFIKERGRIINDANYNTYVYLPYWFKIEGDSMIVEELTWDKLPYELKEQLNKSRK